MHLYYENSKQYSSKMFCVIVLNNKIFQIISSLAKQKFAHHYFKHDYDFHIIVHAVAETYKNTTHTRSINITSLFLVYITCHNLQSTWNMPMHVKHTNSSSQPSIFQDILVMKWCVCNCGFGKNRNKKKV